MTGTSSERAAVLSARIHRAINREGRMDWTAEFEQATGEEFYWFCIGWNRGLTLDRPHIRLGAELHAIVLGNRGTT